MSTQHPTRFTSPIASRFPTLAKGLLTLFLMAVLHTTGGGVALAHGAIRYDNGQWFDGKSFQTRTVYSVEGVLRFEYKGDVDSVVDLRSNYVIPPFGDAHSHALASPQFDEEQLSFLTTGTFYVANPNSMLEWSHAARQKAATPETVDVRYAMGGLTSSGGHPVQIYDGVADQVADWSRESMDGRAYFVVDDKAALDRQWTRVRAGRPDFIKVYLQFAEHHRDRVGKARYYGKRGLDPTLLPEIVRRAHADGLRVAAHVTSAFDFKTAVDAGVDEIAHLPLEQIDAKSAQNAARQGTVVVTTTLSHRPADHVDDLPALHKSNLELLQRYGVRIALGTDSHASILDEARNVAHLTGLRPVEMLDLLTRVTPGWIFPGRKIGRLQPGYEASFLLLDKNPLHDPSALDSIGARVKGGHLLDVTAPDKLPSIDRPLMHKAMTEGLDATIAEYHRLRREEPDAWDFSEQQLNGLGYAMLNHDQIDAAIEIFKLNVEMFPDASNPYDSLAEAYAKRGDRELAIQNYRRSIELNPNNTSAVEKLKKLKHP